ncbi:MAG: POTRA domain-containing protein, partial [Fidelibacterota bacterium]
MKKKIFLIFCINVFCLSQAAEVTQITIKGNKHTEDAIILREIHHPIPGEFVKSVAEEDRNRIYNLGIFSAVEVTQNGSNYQVSVVEGPRWIPFPIIDYNEAKGKEGWSYGLGLKLLNFRGINETVDLGLTFGDVNNYFLELYDPWIAGNHISFGASISDHTNSHAYYNFRFTQQEVALITGFYVRQVHKFNA